MPVTGVFNPFVNSSLRFPGNHLESVARYATTGVSSADPDRRPFRRYVDIWWVGMCIGISEEQQTSLPANEWHTFSYGSILSSDPWRIIHLQLLAVGLTGSRIILNDPGEIVQMANEYAATGIPLLFERMNQTAEPIMEVSEFLRGRCVSSRATSDALQMPA